LALLQIAAATPNYFQIPDREQGQKGDWVVAISNAFKVAEKQEPLSVTLGVVSLRTSIEARLNSRDVAYRGQLVLLDQITSNPGAAGGVVVTIDGRLVGMIGKIIDSSETNTRLNYAIPNSVLRDFLNPPENAMQQTAETGETVYLGIDLFAHGGRDSPAYIDRVRRESPAFKARLKADDLIISMAGEKIGNARDYQQALRLLRAGEEAIIVVKRGSELLRLTLVPTGQEGETK
jgi:serine protease Do